MSAGKRRGKRFLIIIAIAAAALLGGIIVAVAVSIRVETGEWRMPTKGDFIRIARRFDHKPSKTIFLERAPVDLTPGEDDAAHGISSVLANASNKPARSKGWSGGNSKWKSLVTCVRKMFHPFDVTITDERPTSDNFLMVVVGGKPEDIGLTGAQRVSGLAPFNGTVIPRAVVYAFSATSNNDVNATCETIAMEVAHAYGLDHEYLCKDVMTYLTGCGAKSFVDADAPCGESEKRACEGGVPTQNSYQQLLKVLGPGLGQSVVAQPEGTPVATPPAKSAAGKPAADGHMHTH